MCGGVGGSGCFVALLVASVVVVVVVLLLLVGYLVTWLVGWLVLVCGLVVAIGMNKKEPFIY